MSLNVEGRLSVQQTFYTGAGKTSEINQDSLHCDSEPSCKKGWAHLSGTEQSVIYLYLPLGQGQVSAMEKVFCECSVRNNS